MNGSTRPSGLGPLYLVGGVLLVTAVALFGSLALVLECPECEGGTVGVVTRIKTPSGYKTTGCTRCEGKGRETLLKRLLVKPLSPNR